VGPASVMVGTIVQGNRLATAQGRDIGIIDMESDSNKTVRVNVMSYVNHKYIINKSFGFIFFSIFSYQKY
jgi:hypothetical protein